MQIHILKYLCIANEFEVLLTFNDMQTEIFAFVETKAWSHIRWN